MAWPPRPPPAPTPKASGPTASATVIARAKEWVDAKLHYCQSPNGVADGDRSCSSVCRRQSNPAWDPYRSDCSGFVSWAWSLPPPGRTTWGFAPSENDISHTIDGHNLQPGDALNLYTEHIILFVNWVTPGSVGHFYEEPGCSSSTPYASAFTSSVSISGSTVYVSYLGMTMQAIRWNSIVQNGAGSVNVPPPISDSYGPCSYQGAHGRCLNLASGCPGGQFRASSQGASGCQNFPNDVKCCLFSSALLMDQYSAYEPSAATISMASALANNLGAIIGGVIVGVLVLACVIMLAVFFIRKRSSDTSSSAISFTNAAYSTKSAATTPSTTSSPNFL